MTREAAVVLLLAATGCASGGLPRIAAPRSALELRQIQSRTYPESDARGLLRATLSTFQDQGFTIRSSEPELGLISATRQVLTQGPASPWQRFLRGYMGLCTYGLALLVIPSKELRVAELEGTARVEDVGSSEARLRISFQLRVVDGKGAVRDLVQVDDPATFQAFLAAVDRNLFLQREKL
jgi:hypothetical protein